MDIETIQIHGIGGAVLVAALVKALTVAGMKTKYAPLAALITGFCVAALVVLEQYYSWIKPLIDVLIIGLTLGLGASGAYSWYTAGKTSTPPPASEQEGVWVATYKPTTPGAPPAAAVKPTVDAGPHEL